MGRNRVLGVCQRGQTERDRDQGRKLLSGLDNNKRTYDAPGRCHATGVIDRCMPIIADVCAPNSSAGLLYDASHPGRRRTGRLSRSRGGLTENGAHGFVPFPPPPVLRRTDAPRTPAALHAPRWPPSARPAIGPEVWIKRDDQLGLFPGGNKTRKLEFLVADALAQGADTLITCGAPQSNHCRITLSAAVKEGLRCRFVIEERVPHSFREDASGNHFLFRLMGVEVAARRAGGHRHARRDGSGRRWLAREGRRGYVIPGGGSNAIGGLGYVACVQELMAQSFDMGLRFDQVIVGSGSSGTHGGMLAGCPRPSLGRRAHRHRRQPRPRPAGAAGAAEAQARARPARHGHHRARRGGALRRRLLAAEVLGAQRADGRGRADAGAHRRRAARSGLHRARSWLA